MHQAEPAATAATPAATAAAPAKPRSTTQTGLLALMLLGAVCFGLQLQMSHGWKSSVQHFESSSLRRLKEAPRHLARQMEVASLTEHVGPAVRPSSLVEVGASHSACAHRKPYHVVLTAASGVYQEWQTRIAYRQYLTLKESEPCSDLGGFTRLLNTPDAQPDGLMDEIPTVLVRQLKGGVCDECDHHFVVMNRPWGLRQFLEHPAYARIPESYLFIVETDHLLLRPPPNRATEATPVGFGFYYMTYKYDPPKLRPVVAKYHDPDAPFGEGNRNTIHFGESEGQVRFSHVDGGGGARIYFGPDWLALADEWVWLCHVIDMRSMNAGERYMATYLKREGDPGVTRIGIRYEDGDPVLQSYDGRGIWGFLSPFHGYWDDMIDRDGLTNDLSQMHLSVDQIRVMDGWPDGAHGPPF